MPRVGRPGVVVYRDLARAVSEVLLDLPRDKHNNAMEPKLVKIIFGAITKALRRKESVFIPGFGTFRIWFDTRAVKPHRMWKIAFRPNRAMKKQVSAAITEEEIKELDGKP